VPRPQELRDVFAEDVDGSGTADAAVEMVVQQEMDCVEAGELETVLRWHMKGLAWRWRGSGGRQAGVWDSKAEGGREEVSSL